MARSSTVFVALRVTAIRGDPGNDQAVGVVDEVIAGQRVDEVAVAAQVGSSDRHELAIPTRRRDAPCRVESTRVPFQQRSHRHDGRRVGRVGVRRDPGDRVGITADRLSDHQLNAVVGHGANVHGRADSAADSRRPVRRADCQRRVTTTRSPSLPASNTARIDTRKQDSMLTTTVRPTIRRTVLERVRPWWPWIATAFSFPPAGYLAHTVAGPVDGVGAALVSGLVAGAVIGTAQWAVLRRRGASPRWIVATAAGFGVGLAAGAALVGYATSLAALVVMGAVCGAVIGVAQAASLSPTPSPRAQLDTRHRCTVGDRMVGDDRPPASTSRTSGRCSASPGPSSSPSCRACSSTDSCPPPTDAAGRPWVTICTSCSAAAPPDEPSPSS